jgi:Uncharacterized protein conserved in bacteria
MGAVVLFDGVCNFCDASVNFIIEHDKTGYFKFAPLQSEEGARLANQYGFSIGDRRRRQRGERPDTDRFGNTGRGRQGIYALDGRFENIETAGSAVVVGLCLCHRSAADT